jgi:hypothetical protein
MKLSCWWAVRRSHRGERGDIPGWVMITVMTIVIASAILVIFQDRVTTFLSTTLNDYM